MREPGRQGLWVLCGLCLLLAGPVSGARAVGAERPPWMLHAGQLLASDAGEAASGQGRCATVLLNEIKSLEAGIDPEKLGPLGSYLERPTDLPEFLDTPHFRIHYGLEPGESPAGWPERAYLEEIARVCEQVWARSHEGLDLPLPPSDGARGDPPPGGDGRVDVYVRDLGWGVFGYALHEELVGERGMTGFIVLDNDYAELDALPREEALRVALAHEYQHLIQFGYGYSPANGWFMEQAATMLEGEIFPGIDDRLRYLPHFTQRPYRRLTLADGAFEYGAWLWPRFLCDYGNAGVGRMTAIWEHWARGAGTILAACDEVLAEAGLTLADAFLEWSLWNATLDSPTPEAGYPAGSRYASRMGREAVLTRFPVRDFHPQVTHQPEALGASFIELRPQQSAADNQLEMRLRACPSLAGAVLLTWRSDRPGCTRYPLMPVLASEDQFELQLPEWDQIESACLVIAHGPDAPSCCDYALDVTTRYDAYVHDPSLGGAGRLGLGCAPNPFEPFTVISFRLPEPLPVQLCIYDTQGRLVETLLDGVGSVGEHGICWRGTGSAGTTSGIFFCEIRTPLGCERLRLIRVR